MLTRPGWGVLVGVVAGTAAGRLFGVTELYVLAAVGGALLALGLVWVRRPAPRLEVRRSVNPGRPSVGGTGRVEVTIANTGARRLPPVSVVDPVEGTVGARMAVGPLAAGVRQDVGYRLPSLRRGLLHVGPLTIEITDPFGLARRRLSGAGELAITVLPAIDPAPSLPMGGGRHEPLAGLSRRVLSTSGAEDLVTLRPYVVGDDLRRVHWPSTARSDELQVRRDEERWQGHLAVLLDARADAMGPAEFERAVSAAAGIVDAVAVSGDRVRFATTAGHDAGMVDAQRAGHALFEDLALVRQVRGGDAVLPLADPRRPVTLIVLTGDRSTPIAPAARDAGFDDVLVVTFSERAAPPDRRGVAGSLIVGPGEPFADAWRRGSLAGAPP